MPELPIAVVVHFDKYCGPQFFQSNERKNWIPINPLTIYSEIAGGNRTQYPLRLAYSMTITRSQGQTLGKGVIDLGPKERTLGIAFVALSRFKNINDFLIMPFSYDRLSKIKDSKCLKPRIEEENRLKYLIIKTIDNFHFLLNQNN